MVSISGVERREGDKTRYDHGEGLFFSQEKCIVIVLRRREVPKANYEIREKMRKKEKRCLGRKEESAASSSLLKGKSLRASRRVPHGT